jgi:hypothetical protein
VLEYCASPIARDGLVAALSADPLEVRARSAQALLKLSGDHPALAVPPAPVILAAEQQLRSGGNSHQVCEFVFNLLALAFEREPMRIAARAFLSTDVWMRGTSLEYLETVLPPSLLASLRPLVDLPATVVPQREASAVKADLYKAGMTMTVSLADVRRQLEAASEADEEGTA